MSELEPPVIRVETHSIERTGRVMNDVKNELRLGMVGEDIKRLSEIAVECLFAGQDLAIEGVPGVGKTVTSSRIAHTLSGSDDEYHRAFSRVQGQPDLMPSDLRGHEIYHKDTEKFDIVKGPLFKPVVHVDEANRMRPGTQSALNERQAERQITIDGKTLKIEGPSFIVVTYNPNEYGEGTYPIPSATLDRYGASHGSKRPSEGELLEALKGADARDQLGSEEVHIPGKKLDISELAGHRQVVRGTSVDLAAQELIVDATKKLRETSNVSLIADGFRASLVLQALAKARAVRTSKDVADVSVTPDIVRELAPNVYAHRMAITGPRNNGRDDRSELEEIITKAFSA